MKLTRKIWAVLAVLMVIATACGDAPDETSTADVSGLSRTHGSSAEIEPWTQPAEVEAEAVPPAAAPTAVAVLQAAVTFEPQSTLRMTSSTGQIFKAPYAGIDIESAADLSRPLATATRLPDGSTHVYADMGPVMAVWANGDPTLEAAFDQANFSMWMLPNESVTMDTNGYQSLADVTGIAAIRPFHPGVWTVDSVPGTETAQLSQYLIGTSIPDPDVVAELLPAALTNPRLTNDGKTITGTANWGDIAPILGSDISIDARNQAAAVAQLIELDIEDLTAAYVEVFETSETWVEITIPENSSDPLIIRSDMDLSHVYDVIFAEGTAVAEAMDAELLAGIRQGFDLVRLESDLVITIQAVPDTTLPDLPTATENRTAEVMAYLGLG